MKKVLSVLVSVLLVISFSSTVMAAGNWRKGKKSFKAECMNCHKRGGEAKRLKINKKTKAGWTKFFSSGYEADHAALWNKLTDEQREHLIKYFHKYAKDDKATHLGCG